MNTQPNTEHMLGHLMLLFDWTHEHYPHARFEIRCLHPFTPPVRSRCFDVSDAGYNAAAEYASSANLDGFNCYVTVNPLKPGTNHTATDDDVERAIHHYADFDTCDSPDTVIEERCQGFPLAFDISTGTIPTPRCHTYWRMSEPVTDMTTWRETQHGLAVTLGTDVKIKNPARIDRLAGSISYPTEVKRKHGYVTEVTSLGSQRGGDVCRDSFTSLYRMAVQPAPPAARSEAATAPLAGTGALVPLIAVQAALEAIPAISGPDRRNEWLDLAHAVKDANPNARLLFNQWHIQSDRYDPRDDSVFDTIDPTDGSYLSLFRSAKHHDPRWWSHDPDVWEWWRARSARLEAETAPNQPTGGPDPDAEAEPVRQPRFTMVRLRDLSLSVPPREFIYGHSLVRGMLSILGGTGGVGKTSYMLTVLISIALGRPLLATESDEPQHRLYEPKGIVAYYSLEDPMDDLVRRVNAIILAYRLNPRQIWDKVLLQSGRDQTLVVAATDQRGRLIRTNVDPIVDFLIDNKVTVFAVDPFANSFDGADGTESSSDAMKIICDQYRQIVHRANCAGWMAHHFRKGGLAGDADAFRGSTMLQNAARCMETLSTMTKEDAETLGVNDYERRSYMRLENAKVNLTAAPAEGQWFKLEGVPLGNGTEKYPQGDVVGVPFRWLPQPVELSWSQIETTLNAIDAGCENGTEYYSSKHNSSRYAVDVIVSCTGLKRKQAKAMMEEWLAIGVLERDTYTSKKSRAEVERLMVNQAAKQHLQTCAK